MGKIKSKQVKRSAHSLMNANIEFSEDFERNKKILGKEMPSKKMRNQMAGYLSRFKKKQAAEKQVLEVKE